MSRFLGVVFSHTRSIQVYHYKDKVVFDIPLLLGETIRAINPEIYKKEGGVEISFCNVEWIKFKDLQNASITSPLLTTNDTKMSLNDSTESSRSCLS